MFLLEKGFYVQYTKNMKKPSKKLELIGTFLMFVLSSCEGGKTRPYFSNDVSFGTYDELLDDLIKEDQIKKNHNPDCALDSFKFFDASLDGANKVEYHKLGVDYTTDFDNKECGDTRILFSRWILIKNFFTNYEIFISFYSSNLNETSVDSFKWDEDIKENRTAIDYSCGFYGEMDSYILNYSNLYKGSKAYRIIDSNGERILNMYVLCYENADSISKFYFDSLMSKAKEIYE